jgi:DMSO/TMAO reductase YedYZ molybdopterin-dependent catalytic subunit
MARTLEALFRYLDGLKGRPPLHELAEQLKELDVRAEDVAPFVRFGDGQYQRNLARAGDEYNVWVLCWKNGQRSPIHDHAGSACGVRVLRGTATVTRFEFAPNGHIKAMDSKDFAPGSVLANQDSDLHQVSNLQAGSADLVTLHVYSPPLLRMKTYSLFDLSRGEDVWAEERKVVTASPENSETPLEHAQSWVTPNRLFFVRNHFAVPTLSRTSWRLTIGGCVRRPVELTWSDLTALPERSVFATVECAGNGRSFLKKREPGVQWGAGAIGHAEWTGVPLHLVLEEAGLKPEAVEVLCEGADRGSEADHPEPMHFARSLPLEKALHPDTLLVYRMNGELLQPSHGSPLRLFVPGWYGVASVKWLQRIEVLDRPFRGYFQSVKYTVQRSTPQGLQSVVVGPMAVKSEILRPRPGAVRGTGMNRIFGVAWAGDEAVAVVEVSTDGGATWGRADLIGMQAPYCWTLWEYLWEVAQPGTYEIVARAASARGRVQPMEHDLLNGGYMIHHSRPVSVVVTGARRRQDDHADEAALLYDMNAYAEENARVPLDVDLAFSGGEGI